MSNPKPGDRARVHYGQAWRRVCQLHGQVGVIVTASRKRPRNHLIDVAGKRYVVPCGNLNPAPGANDHA